MIEFLWTSTSEDRGFHQLFPASFISASTVLFQVLLCPWGFQLNACFSTASWSFHRVRPIHCHFHFFIWRSTSSSLAVVHRPLSETTSSLYIFIILLEHRFINRHLNFVCNSLWEFLSSQPYSKNNLLLLNILNLVQVVASLLFHKAVPLQNLPFLLPKFITVSTSPPPRKCTVPCILTNSRPRQPVRWKLGRC